jgi:hypothetical protein
MAILCSHDLSSEASTKVDRRRSFSYCRGPFSLRSCCLGEAVARHRKSARRPRECRALSGVVSSKRAEAPHACESSSQSTTAPRSRRTGGPRRSVSCTEARQRSRMPGTCEGRECASGVGRVPLHAMLRVSPTPAPRSKGRATAAGGIRPTGPPPQRPLVCSAFPDQGEASSRRAGGDCPEGVARRGDLHRWRTALTQIKDDSRPLSQHGQGCTAGADTGQLGAGCSRTFDGEHAAVGVLRTLGVRLRGSPESHERLRVRPAPAPPSI